MDIPSNIRVSKRGLLSVETYDFREKKQRSVHPGEASTPAIHRLSVRGVGKLNTFRTTLYAMDE